MRRFRWNSEPRTRDGAPMLSVNHVVLLNALRDFPDAQAPSHEAWLVVAFRYARIAGMPPNQWGLRRSMRTCRPEWVTKARRGNAKTATLTARGLGILDRTVPAWVRGCGVYRGVRPSTKK